LGFHRFQAATFALVDVFESGVCQLNPDPNTGELVFGLDGDLADILDMAANKRKTGLRSQLGTQRPATWTRRSSLKSGHTLCLGFGIGSPR